ncbi:sensor histidine kinase [Pontibacter anaerobius]|uniref:histidine kinase n=1 Tax=Pontibacter anaerobius TaxID=2993940 RepID=A0ABT3RG09_9BACT|nr:PAS domain-containing sensor histidine kinase [Pontibacter anaerobius]MCX2740777.1 PAS domain-containing sensor histidine kinase [Pontibacter anaerobius]
MRYTNTTTNHNEYLNVFRGGGEMGAMMRAYDWESHPLGNPQHWPESLKTNIRLMLNSRFPMFIWWTKDLYMFHNDAYLPALGKKHPKALGASAREMWVEIWEQIGDIAENILAHGDDFYAENLLMFLERKGFAEETYWTFSYSPAFNDAGEVEGIFCACNEETSFVMGQRRLKTLKDISDALSQVQTLEKLGTMASAILNENQSDLPFSLIYLSNGIGSEARLTGKSGAIAGELAPELINLRLPMAVWPFDQVQQKRQSIVLDLHKLQPGNYSTEAANLAVILPILKPGQDQVIGFFVSGISARQEYNEAYQGFHSLLTSQLATSISSVQSRQEILKRQEYLNDIFQQAPVGITMLRGSQYIIDIANPGVCEIWRVKPEEALGKPILEVIPEAIEQGFKDLLDRVMTTGVPFVAYESPLVLERNGKQETVYLNFVYHPLRDDQGFVTGVIAVAIDISEQVKARQKIESINKELLATNADLDNFVYSASHDLKAPIYNIEGLVSALVEYLPQEGSSSVEVQQLSKHIHSSINRFKKVVTDLTQVAKVQREAGEDVSTIRLDDFVAEVLLDFKPTIAASSAIIETRVSPDAVIQFSAKNLRSVVYNLISNAIKYRSPDRNPHISISTETTPEHLILVVADNGLGINTNEVQKMFSMFKRLHDHVEGSGIGLYIVKKILDNAGGSVEVESEVGKGTTFRVYLKRKL